MASVLADKCVTEADFNEWLARIQRHLRSRGLTLTNHVPTCVKAALHVSRNAQPELLLKVPPADLLDYTKLVEHLRRLTRPFRFMDLSPELRNMIYDYTLPRNLNRGRYSRLCMPRSILTTSGRKRVLQSPLELPAITRVSKQVRGESLAFFAATRHLRMYLGTDFEPERMDRCIRQWVSVAASVYLRHIRQFTLDLGTNVHHFTFSAARGLELVVTSRGIPLDRQNALLNHVQAMEAERKILGLQGESIIMAIIRKPELW